MLDLAGYQGTSAAHHEACRLHLDAHRPGPELGLVCGVKADLGPQKGWDASGQGEQVGQRPRAPRPGLRFRGGGGASRLRSRPVSLRSRRWLETQVRVLSPPVASRDFICFPARPPTPPPQPCTRPRGEESLGLGELPELGAAPVGSDKVLWVPPPGRGGLAPRGCQVSGDSRKPKRTSGGTGAQDQTLGTGLRRAWAGGQPRPVLVYQRRLSQCHAFLARNYFQESAFGDIIGPCSERAFYSNLSALSKSMGCSAIGQRRESTAWSSSCVFSISEWHRPGTESSFCWNLRNRPKNGLFFLVAIKKAISLFPSSKTFPPLGLTLLIKNKIQKGLTCQFDSLFPLSIRDCHSILLYEMSFIQIFA